MPKIEKIIIVTKKTWLEELIERFNTKAQAKFYIEHMGGNFDDYQDAHNQYYTALEQLKRVLPSHIKTQVVERSFLSNFLFGPQDLIVVIGPDGLVINTAKYLKEQYIVAVNPDSSRIDGILLPFIVEEVPLVVKKLEANNFNAIRITMAMATLNNQQSLLGVNDLFIGHKSHGSARYNITYKGITEAHSSSGVIVSTGAGSTGWFKSIVTGAIAITNEFRKELYAQERPTEDEYRFPWDASYVYFSVREPWTSKTSSAAIVFGPIYAGDYLTIESKMPENGVIFSDGIEKDFIDFNSGTIAQISVADKKANLILR